jgi:protein-disulfide isomerase
MRAPAALAAALSTLAALSCGVTSGKVGRAPAPVAAPGAAPLLEPEEALPGIDLSPLSQEQRKALAAWAGETFCACGCPHTVSSCLRTHAPCKHAPRMVRLAMGLAVKGATAAEIGRIVQAYYQGFDRRARLDTAGLGPPMGTPGAKITLVIVSDFTCPFCKIFVPTVEQFVKEHAAAVRLLAKPFPIASHPGAQEAAEAGEWAREKGLYWELSAALYGMDEEPTVDRIAAVVSRLGGDPADLRDALATGRYRERVARSQAEARAAGIKGTPTVFMNGRIVEDLTEDGLAFALEDEEEWIQHGSWARD